MENGASRLAFATVSATFDVICSKPVGEILAGEAKADLFDEIGMRQVDIARLTHLFGKAVNQLWSFERAIGRFTDAGYGY